MLAQVLTYLETRPEATNFHLCETFGLSRGMADRLLEMFQDAGQVVIEKPQSGCSSGGGCSTGGCSSGGCSTASGALNALADAARAKKTPVSV